MAVKPAAAPVPAQPITIAEVKPPGVIDKPVETGDYQPTADDLVRLAKNSASSAPEPTSNPSPEPVPERVIIPTSAQTLAEMEEGRKINERWEEERRKRMEQ